MRQFHMVHYGKSEPKGSSRGFPIKRKNGRIGVSITSDNPALKRFTSALAQSASLAMRDKVPFAKQVPLSVVIDFYIERPKSVPKSRIYPVVKPDIDKLERGAYDALTGIVYYDDAQIVETHPRKLYGDERIEISITAL